jgi:thiamine transport system substrate-binding protein
MTIPRPAARSMRTTARPVAILLATAAILTAGCGGDDDADTDSSSVPADASSTLTLVAYDSFPVADTDLNTALGSFTEQTGIDIEILIAGDTGTMVSKAALTAGNPEGDVIWGIDNTFISRAIEADVLEAYTPSGAPAIPERLRAGAPGGIATPVTYGDVCVNVDLAWFAERGLDVPVSFEDLADEAYRDLLVVQNPATSSPGLAFVAATVAAFGDRWPDYWADLRANGVAVTDGWTEAYYERFTHAGGGDRPLVVSYGSSPPAEVIFAPEPLETAPTGVIEATCFRQVEFAGILRGTSNPTGARQLLDFLVSAEFQSTLPFTLFVYPAVDAVELPDEFVQHAVIPAEPLGVDAAVIESERADWIEQWTETVLR